MGWSGVRASVSRRFRSVTVLTLAIVMACALGLARWTARGRAQERVVARYKQDSSAWFQFDYQCVDGKPVSDTSPWMPALLRETFGDDLLLNVVWCQFYPGKVGNDDLKVLADLPSLRYLDLSSAQEQSRLTDDGLAHLAAFPTLERLNLANNRIGNRSMLVVARMPGMRDLDITLARVDNNGLQLLAGLTSMRDLSLNATLIDDDGLAALSGMAKLETLDLGYTRIKGSGLERLPHPQAIKKLSLSATYLDDQSMPLLARFQGLQELNLADNPGITDAAIEVLIALPSLKNLDVNGTRITNQGLARLTAAKPGLWFVQRP